MFNLYSLIIGIGIFFGYIQFFGFLYWKKIPQLLNLFIYTLLAWPIIGFGARFWTYLFDSTFIEEMNNLGYGGNFLDQLKYFLGFTEYGIRGLSIHGGLIFGFGYFFILFKIYSKKYQLSIWIYFDVLVRSILITQIFGRWGNFFNQELLGKIITINYPDQYGWIPNWLGNKLKFNESDLSTTLRHPLFLYESFGNFLALIILFSGNFWKTQITKLFFPKKPIKIIHKTPYLEVKPFFPKKYFPKLISKRFNKGKSYIFQNYSGWRRRYYLFLLYLQRNSQRITKHFDLDFQFLPFRTGSSFSFYLFSYGLIRLILQPMRDIGNHFQINNNSPMAITNYVSIIFIILGILLFLFFNFIHPKKIRSLNWKYEKLYKCL